MNVPNTNCTIEPLAHWVSISSNIKSCVKSTESNKIKVIPLNNINNKCIKRRRSQSHSGPEISNTEFINEKNLSRQNLIQTKESQPMENSVVNSGKNQNKKETHNRVERKRRNFINSQIHTLSELLPPEYFVNNDLKMNKGLILKSSVDYINSLKLVYNVNEHLVKETEFASRVIKLLLKSNDIKCPQLFDNHSELDYDLQSSFNQWFQLHQDSSKMIDKINKSSAYTSNISTSVKSACSEEIIKRNEHKSSPSSNGRKRYSSVPSNFEPEYFIAKLKSPRGQYSSNNNNNSTCQSLISQELVGSTWNSLLKNKLIQSSTSVEQTLRSIYKLESNEMSDSTTTSTATPDVVSNTSATTTTVSNCQQLPYIIRTENSPLSQINEQSSNIIHHHQQQQQHHLQQHHHHLQHSQQSAANTNHSTSNNELNTDNAIIMNLSNFDINSANSNTHSQTTATSTNNQYQHSIDVGNLLSSSSLPIDTKILHTKDRTYFVLPRLTNSHQESNCQIRLMDDSGIDEVVISGSGNDNNNNSSRLMQNQDSVISNQYFMALHDPMLITASNLTTSSGVDSNQNSPNNHASSASLVNSNQFNNLTIGLLIDASLSSASTNAITTSSSSSSQHHHSQQQHQQHQFLRQSNSKLHQLITNTCSSLPGFIQPHTQVLPDNRRRMTTTDSFIGGFDDVEIEEDDVDDVDNDNHHSNNNSNNNDVDDTDEIDEDVITRSI